MREFLTKGEMFQRGQLFIHESLLNTVFGKVQAQKLKSPRGMYVSVLTALEMNDFNFLCYQVCESV